MYLSAFNKGKITEERFLTCLFYYSIQYSDAFNITLKRYSPM